ncbi:MAG: hypothetical protein DYG89_20030 [Caldilinea sp. CFX5]|nr:hypothetical protein [Caldilinea sp. CFX5]
MIAIQGAPFLINFYPEDAKHTKTLGVILRVLRVFGANFLAAFVSLFFRNYSARNQVFHL